MAQMNVACVVLWFTVECFVYTDKKIEDFLSSGGLFKILVVFISYDLFELIHFLYVFKFFDFVFFLLSHGDVCLFLQL